MKLGQVVRISEDKNLTQAEAVLEYINQNPGCDTHDIGRDLWPNLDYIKSANKANGAVSGLLKRSDQPIGRKQLDGRWRYYPSNHLTVHRDIPIGKRNFKDPEVRAKAVATRRKNREALKAAGLPAYKVNSSILQPTITDIEDKAKQYVWDNELSPAQIEAIKEFVKWSQQ